MTGHISDHRDDCDLVAKPDTGPLRGWVCTCKESAPEWVTGEASPGDPHGLLAPPVPHHQDCPFNGLAGADPDANLCPYCPPLHKCEARARSEQHLVSRAIGYNAGFRSGQLSAKDLMAAERDKVAVLVRDGLPEYGQADQRFLDGVSHAWSVLFHATRTTGTAAAPAAESGEPGLPSKFDTHNAGCESLSCGCEPWETAACEKCDCECSTN